MFVVTDKQMKILGAEMERAFTRRMVEYLRQYFPPQTKGMTDAELKKMVEAATARAAGYGITAEEDVQKFLELMMRFGKNFDQDPAVGWAGTILRPKDIDGARKMRRLANRIRMMDEGLV